MNRLKLLIADSAEDFSFELTEKLQDRYQVKLCRDGLHVQEEMQLLHPDILVLDLMLPGLDGITLLQWAGHLGLHPAVIATTGYCSDYMTGAAERLGVSYIMRKPCCADACAARVDDLARQIAASPTPGPDPRTQVSNLLLQLGFSAKLKGYSYLREGILLFAKDVDQGITKELYPAVGQLFHSTGQRVERAIRSAVQSAWEAGPREFWHSLFVQTDGTLRCPTNGEFIARVADRLLLETELSARD